MQADEKLRNQIVGLLRGGNAHMPFAEAVADFPEGMINLRPRNVPYSFWHLLEHLRLTQLDILEYVTSADYREKEWPRDYWPASDAEATKQQWDETIARFNRDLEQLIGIVSDKSTDLFAPVPSNPEHNLLREMLIVADHNAYHVGELGILRQVEGAWGSAHRQMRM
jgi:DinB family protein